MSQVVVRGNQASVSHTFAAAATGNVTYTVTKADGTTLTSGTATGSNPYTFTLAAQTALNLLTVTWTATIGGLTTVEMDQVEIGGGVYVPLADLRALPGLLNTGTYPDSTLLALRREFEDIAEWYVGVAFVPRYARETYAGGNSTILLRHPNPRALLSVTSTDSGGAVTTYTTTNWRLAASGMLSTEGTYLPCPSYGEQNVTVEYEHGMDTPPPQIVHGCKVFVRNRALQDARSVGRDVLREVNDNGFQIQYSTPDWNAGRPTGLFEVDAALNSVGRYPSVA